jgi:D-glycero-alpha-D-manno-heptose-7-phosphate kinase
MVLTVARAPLRISFIGGGTDYPAFFQGSKQPGYVIGGSIDQYVYVSALNQPPFEKVRYRITYRKTDSVRYLADISHPVVRAILTERKWGKPLNLATMASLPGRSGLGSSSAFTVALIRLMDHLQDITNTPFEIAIEAINVEREILKEAGGYQDQLHSAIGGMRLYKFTSTGISYSEPISQEKYLAEISKSLVLVAVGGSRSSSQFATQTTEMLSQPQTFEYCNALSRLTLTTYEKIISATNPNEIIELIAHAMNQGWKLKKLISGHKSDAVDKIITRGIYHGAISGKLCGAGGSGFALFIVPQDLLSNFKANFNEDDMIFPSLTTSGVQIATF